MATHKVYVDTENLSREQLEQLLIDKEEEIWTLKSNVEFLHSCLDDREGSIELMKDKINKLEEVKDLLRKIVIDIGKLDELRKIIFKNDAKLEK